MKHIALYLAVASLLSGCFLFNRADDATYVPSSPFYVAESLAVAHQYHQAADAFSSFAEKHSESNDFAFAARNAAYLYAHPLNTAHDDSASLYWFQRYLTLPLAETERQQATMYVGLLQRIVAMKAELVKRSVESSSRSNRTRELETLLKQANDELKKLRDVDVNIHRRGVKK